MLNFDRKIRSLTRSLGGTTGVVSSKLASSWRGTETRLRRSSMFAVAGKLLALVAVFSCNRFGVSTTGFITDA
jgi:hypothetical protein